MFSSSNNLYTLLRIDGLVISNRMKGAFSFSHRAQGLIGQRLSDNGALWLRPGGGIHTFGMCCPIDVLFLNKQLTVLAVAKNVKPWRIKFAPANTHSTVELTAGRIARMGLQVGDELFIQPGESSDEIN